MKIREVKLSDVSEITTIINHYIKHTNYLLDLELISEDSTISKIKEVTKSYPFIVAEDNKGLLGFAHGYCYNNKAGYNTTAGTTIYLDTRAQGKGFGTRLYHALLSSLPLYDIKVAIGGITSGNAASVAIHEKLGFRKVAHFEKVAYKFDEWLDVEYWQKEV
jgi:phosphinothricin acetyltransferase